VIALDRPGVAGGFVDAVLEGFLTDDLFDVLVAGMGFNFH
jgi:hypothetical protein